MSDASHELVLYIVNDGDLYRQRTTPILENLRRKQARGAYDRELAVKAFKYLADAGAKAYAREHARASEWNRIFSPRERQEAARELARYYEGTALGIYSRDRSRFARGGARRRRVARRW